MKLIGLGDRDDYLYFIFQKDQKLFQLFRKILLTLGENETRVESTFLIPEERYDTPDFKYLKPKGIKTKNKRLELDIKTISDERFNFYEDSFNIDIIIGVNQVFLLGHVPSKKVQEIKRIVSELCEF